MKKSVYSLAPLRELLLAANRHYLEFISAIEEDKAGTDKLHKISQPVEENDRAYRGFNLFVPDDEQLFRSLARGEFNISGFQNKDLRRRTNGKNSGQISRTVQRLRVHGLVKKVGRTYKYYLTALGKQVMALGLKLKGTLYHSRPLHRTGLLNSSQVRSESFGMALKVKIVQCIFR